MKINHSLLICLLLLSGCCALNTVADKKKAFERSMNDEIGDPIDEHFPQQFVQIIKEWEGPFGENVVVTRNSNGTVTYTEAMYDSKQCLVSRIIEQETWTIRSWNFVDGKDVCKTEPFYCGPW